MDDGELEALLTDIQSERVERKESQKDGDKIGQAICALANDLPGHAQAGVVFIGVKDDGSCAGMQITDELLRNLGGHRDDGRIQPIPSLIVQKWTVGGCEVAVVVVHPSDAPPVRYKGRVWIRVEPRRAIATPEEERRLSERRRFRDLPFDLQPVPQATTEDLDLEFFEKTYLPSSVAADILAENQRTLNQQLASLRFVTVNTPPVPTVTGLLAVGKDPQQFIGGAFIQFLRIDGTELTDPIRSEKRIAGPLGELLRMVDEVFDANISVAVNFTSGPTEQRQPNYPLVALQQVARSAVMHRTYEGTNAPVRVTWFSDRVEILSPGGPFGQVTVDNFGTPGITDYRNRHLAEVLHRLGYVQRFGVGIANTRAAMEKNGNPPPVFNLTPTHVQVTLWRRPWPRRS